MTQKDLNLKKFWLEICNFHKPTKDVIIYILSKLVMQKIWSKLLRNLFSIEVSKPTYKLRPNKTGVINDPLSRTHNLTSSKHCVHLKFNLFC